MSRTRDEVYRQVALYAGIGRESVSDETLLREELGFDSLVILMLLITLAERLEENVFSLHFKLAGLQRVGDVIGVFSPSDTGTKEHCLDCCLH